MSKEATLRKLYDAMNADESAVIVKLVTDDVVVHVLPNELIPGAVLRGRDELIETHERNLAATHLQQEVKDVSEYGTFACVYLEARGVGQDGKERTVSGADLYRFRGEQICEMVGLIDQ